MSENSSLSAEIASMLKKLDTLEDSSPSAARPVRFVVATDWSDAAVPLTILKGFRAIIPPEAGVQLAFALPHEPTENDARCVQVLVEGTDAPEDLRGLEVISFDEAASQPYDAAVVTQGDHAVDIAQVGGLIVRMHDVVRRMDAQRNGGGASLQTAQYNRGDTGVLRERLAEFR